MEHSVRNAKDVAHDIVNTLPLAGNKEFPPLLAGRTQTEAAILSLPMEKGYIKKNVGVFN